MFSSWNFFSPNNNGSVKDGEKNKADQNEIEEDRVVVVPNNLSLDSVDPVVSKLLEWNGDLENKLRETKSELSSISHQLIALTGKQIFLQDKKTLIEDKLSNSEARCMKLKDEIMKLEKENNLLTLRLEFIMRTKDIMACDYPLVEHV
jgi:predicted RNase H-like nuclease (RuvC/YqgF family)